MEHSEMTSRFTFSEPSSSKCSFSSVPNHEQMSIQNHTPSRVWQDLSTTHPLTIDKTAKKNDSGKEEEDQNNCCRSGRIGDRIREDESDGLETPR